MKIVHSLAELHEWREAQDPRESLGLIPTMGFLHVGHISLVDRARVENDLVAATIFANPAQFNNPADLENYPRDIPRDTAMLEAAGCDLVFIPEPAEMYRPDHQTWVQMGSIADPLEGEHRPGHFRGVATIILKLFGLFSPTRAYFGQKDAQQLAVIRRMVADFNIPVSIVGCSTLREPDGLAMSSRNARLGPAERDAAPVLYRALSTARAAFENGETDAEMLRDLMRGVLAREPKAGVEYVSVAHPITLEELSTAIPGAVVSMAVNIGSARLIDNLLLPQPSVSSQTDELRSPHKESA